MNWEGRNYNERILAAGEACRDTYSDILLAFKRGPAKELNFCIHCHVLKTLVMPGGKKSLSMVNDCILELNTTDLCTQNVRHNWVLTLEFSPECIKRMGVKR